MSASESQLQVKVNSAKKSVCFLWPSRLLLALLCFNLLPTIVEADVPVVQPERFSRPASKDPIAAGFYQSKEKNSQDVKDAYMEQLANELKGRMLKVTTLEVRIRIFEFNISRIRS